MLPGSSSPGYATLTATSDRSPAELTSLSSGDLVDQIHCNPGRADLFHEAVLQLTEHKCRHTGLQTVVAHLSDGTTSSPMTSTSVMATMRRRRSYSNPMTPTSAKQAAALDQASGDARPSRWQCSTSGLGLGFFYFCKSIFRLSSLK
jgi:hypothetical protein